MQYKKYSPAIFLVTLLGFLSSAHGTTVIDTDQFEVSITYLKTKGNLQNDNWAHDANPEFKLYVGAGYDGSSGKKVNSDLATSDVLYTHAGQSNSGMPVNMKARFVACKYGPTGATFTMKDLVDGLKTEKYLLSIRLAEYNRFLNNTDLFAVILPGFSTLEAVKQNGVIETTLSNPSESLEKVIYQIQYIPGIGDCTEKDDGFIPS